jgi:formamidopyrimidine-DNA glycosylase
VPELPEVETIARGLQVLVHKRIGTVDVRLPRVVQTPAGADFSRELRGARISAVQRRGKYAVFRLDSGRALVVSLRMTGRLVLSRTSEPESPVARVVFNLTDGTRLTFADVRTLGRVRLVEPGEAWDDALGIEPLSSGFTPQAFIGMLAGRTTPIKVLLLDQRRIAGIGNIYACEALWEARIRPTRAAESLTKPAMNRLHDAIVNVLNRAIAMRGTSVSDYVDANGAEGGFQNVLMVYGKAGMPCCRCGTPIVRTVIGRRGTWWCRTCQR